jgi:hypothetical protein
MFRILKATLPEKLEPDYCVDEKNKKGRYETKSAQNSGLKAWEIFKELQGEGR